MHREGSNVRLGLRPQARKQEAQGIQRQAQAHGATGAVGAQQADIERGFKVLKFEIETAPVFHRLPERIKEPMPETQLALL